MNVQVNEELEADASITEGVLQSITRSAISVLPFSR